MGTFPSELFAKVKYYKEFREDVQSYLVKHPDNWQKFQLDFNHTVEQISLDLLHFEKNNISRDESKIYKFRRIFEKRYRSYFLYGNLTRWTLQKPYGYAGDFKIIDEIYQQTPCTVGFDGLWDTYYLQMTACRATRTRREDMREAIRDFVRQHQGQRLRIMNLGSGPAREIKELLDSDTAGLFANVIFDCYDFDTHALNYARELIHRPDKVNFIQKNAVRLALKKDIKQEIPYEYDAIYSTGLFDYLDVRIAVRLIGNLKHLVKKGGKQIIANFGNKYYNSSAGLMEWVTEWFLIYRKDEEFRKLFLDAGYAPQDLEMKHQPNKVIVYCFATAT